MARAEKNDTTITFDSVTCFVDAANLVQKKIGLSYLEKKPFPGVLAQRMFFRDTTVFEYDAGGLLKKQTCHHRDSNWANVFGRITADAWVTTDVTIYVNTNRNISSSFKNVDEAHYLYDYGTVTTTTTTTSEDWLFDYGKNYSNKTDFSNAAVLGQLGSWVMYPMNKRYRNLPNEYRLTKTLKDNNGNITRNSHSVSTY